MLKIYPRKPIECPSFEIVQNKRETPHWYTRIMPKGGAEGVSVGQANFKSLILWLTRQGMEVDLSVEPWSSISEAND